MAIAKNAPAAKKPEAPKAAKAAPKEVKKEATAKAPAEAEAAAVEKVSRKDIAAAIREKVMAAGGAISPKIAEVAAVSYEEVLLEALAAGKQVSLPGFGNFTVVDRPEAVRPNPQKPGETITVPAHKAPKFKAGSKLKAAVNGETQAAAE